MFYGCVCVWVGFLALGDNWQLYCKALEFYLQQVAAHSILGKSNALYSFLSSTEVQRRHNIPKHIWNNNLIRLYLFYNNKNH